MYTWGHLEIFNVVLQMRQHLLKDQIEQIKKGLLYPDFPCGSYLFNKGRMKFKYKVCSLFRIFKDLSILPNYFASSYASHNGYYSVWHSMTYNPERPVFKIARDIMDQIIAFLSLCFVNENSGMMRDEPTLFWLGMALHVIMDSYSPAHTLRCVGDNCRKYIELAKAHPAKLTPAMHKANVVLKELKDSLMSIASEVDDDDEHQVTEVLANLYKKHRIRDARKKDELMKTAMFIYFHNHHQIHVKELVTNKDVSSKLLKGKFVRPIVTFYSYPQQSAWFHKLNDTMFMLNRKGLKEAVVHDCDEVLTMTFEFLKEPHKNKCKLKRYLRKVYAYLYHNTFTVAPGAAEINTGVAQTFYRNLKLVD